MNQTEEKTRFSIVLCTYNQCDSLALVLGFLSRQKIDKPKEVELIIVDNNSKDNTASICEAGFKDIPFSCRYVFEGRQGLSIARNRGCLEARGEILIFTDDDAKIPADWLQTMIHTYVQHDPDCVYGKIIIDWEKGVPEWYVEDYKSMFVGLDYGDKLLTVTDPHHEFYGKNFSVKKSFLLEMGGFDENLGRKGDRLFIGEETRIYQTLVAKHCKLIYNPNVVVYHMLKDVEYTLENFNKRYSDACFSEYYMLRTNAGKKVLGRPLYALKMIAIFLLMLPQLIKRLLVSPTYANRTFALLQTKKHYQLLLLWLKNPSA